jgi:hypothetical protein
MIAAGLTARDIVRAATDAMGIERGAPRSVSA